MSTTNTLFERKCFVGFTKPRPSIASTIVAQAFAQADISLDGSRPWDIHVKDQRFYSRVLADGTLGLGESYMEGWWECESISEMAFRAIRARLDQRTSFSLQTLAAWSAAYLLNQQTKSRSRMVGLHHYDLGNDFFATMLGPTLQYSCAYFQHTDDLNEAQHQKMDLICRKLDLRPGLRLLDIGCGWGGLAHHAARVYGCSVVGITISKEQQMYAQKHCQGLPVEIRFQDYRDIAEQFDRIVSVGMLEHVGSQNYRAYMQVANRCLNEGGLFLCHTIGDIVSHIRPDPWISAYIFPNSMLPTVAQVARAAEGLFVLEDLHNFGASYDRTLLAWEKNFVHSWPHFRQRYGERFYRMWRYYLLSCAGAFRARNIELFQFVWSKGGIPGGYQAPR